MPLALHDVAIATRIDPAALQASVKFVSCDMDFPFLKN
jgi:hypothetical protein